MSKGKSGMNSSGIIISGVTEARELENKVLASALKATRELAILLSEEQGVRGLFRLKFDPVGYDPLDEHRNLNLIEQINQSFTYLVSLRAVEYLLAEHPEAAPYRLNLGTRAGSDIESLDGSVAAEAFAAVTPDNNGKLQKDIAKVKLVPADHRYVFFSSARPGKNHVDPQVTVKRFHVRELLDVAGGVFIG
jgi:hypothetical protein